MVSIRLTEDVKTIELKINKAIVKLFNTQFNKKQNRLVRDLKALVESWVRSSKEIISLANRGPNELGAEFGIRSSKIESVIDAIVNAIVDATEIVVRRFDEKLRGSILFNFQPKDFANLLSLPEGHVITKAGSDLHWMDWLLKKGNQVIITGYEYEPGRGGRSGGGVMVGGGSYRVNPRYSGTDDNNFVTRLFQDREKEIQNLLIGLFNV